MKAGDLYAVNLDPTIGDEIRKKRPVMVLNGGHEKHLKLAIVVPIMNWSTPWERNPFFVSLEPNLNNGLRRKSIIDCFQTRALSHIRYTERIGRVSDDEIHLVRKAIALILDIDPEHCA